MTNKLKMYKKAFNYSYTSGAYATFELISIRPELIECVYVRSAYRDREVLAKQCLKKSVPCIGSDKAFTRVNQKENSYVLGVFRKYTSSLAPDKPHIVLVNPSDMGNLGTIMRTMTGLNIYDLAIIEPAADIWNPKTIRASMGALFRVRHQAFAGFDAYRRQYPNHCLFPFMLNGISVPEQTPNHPLFSLVFGNEAAGLDSSFLAVGHSVKIPLSYAVDSYNLAVAVGIGAYAFARKNNLV